MHPNQLSSPRLALRPHRTDDFEALHLLWSNPDVVRFITGTPSTPEESWARLLRYIGHWAAFGVGYFAVIDKATGNYLGECGFMDFRREMTPSLEGSAEVGWVLTPEAWGKGVATEAMTAIIAWYGGQPAARPLACIIAPDNAPSIRIATKLGFKLDCETLYRGKPTLVYRRA